MAVPRPLLLALVGVVLVAAGFMATRSSQEATSEPSTPAQQSAAPKPSQPESKPAKQSSEASAGQARKKATQARQKAGASSSSKAAAVARAIARRQTVVLFLYQRRAADDEKTAEAVDALRGRSKAKIFSDTVGHVGRYGPIVGAAGVSQAPSIVIVDKKRRARVIEGYVDPETLAQEVADTR